MTKKCIYCKKQLGEDIIFDVCEVCGYQVWGPKMYQAIIDNMQSASDAGDLYQGSISASPTQDKKKSSWESQSQPQNPSAPREMSFVTEAKNTLAEQEDLRSPQGVDEFRGSSSKSESEMCSKQVESIPELTPTQTPEPPILPSSSSTPSSTTPSPNPPDEIPNLSISPPEESKEELTPEPKPYQEEEIQKIPAEALIPVTAEELIPVDDDY